MSNLDELVAKQAITEQIYNYCRAMDRMDRELGVSVWHPDGLADYGAIFNGTGAGFIEFVCQAHAPMLAHSHQVANVLIKVSGEVAASESYVTATLRFEQDGRVVHVANFGRYLDRWSRRRGRWAIDHRIYVHDFDEVRPAGEDHIVGWGRRDARDPSYAAFEGFAVED